MRAARRWWWLKLARYGRARSGDLAVVVSLMLAASALDVLRPWPLKLLIDYALAGRPLPDGAAWIASLPGAGSPDELLAWLTLGTVALFLGGWSVRALQGYVQTGAGSRMIYALGIDLFDHLQRLSLRFHGRQPTGDLVQRVVSDSNCVRHLVFGVFLPLLTSLAGLAMMFGVMWRLDARLAVAAVAIAPVLGLVIWRRAGPMTLRAQEEAERQGQVMSTAEEVLTALPAVRAFGREEHERSRFRAASWRAGMAYRRTILSQMQFKAATGAVTAAGTALIMAAGGMEVLGGRLSIGGLVVFLSYLGSLYAPLETLAYLSTGYAAAAAGARRVFDILEAEDRVRSAPGARPLAPRPRRHLCMKGVVFGYEPGRPVLHGIDFEAAPGEVVALVGPSGAGKSTLASLIPRFFDPWEGCVELDGHDLRSLQLASVRAQVSVVLQEPFLLPLTVAENIAYGRAMAGRDEIVAAAVAANAHEFIQQLPMGYETRIGQRGETLSGGQKQRLAIARAILKDAPILLLDEPTAALDAATEAELLDALERLMAGKTTVVIAHRLSTIRRAGRIVVIDRGRKVEEGTHEELLRNGSLYARLYALQTARGKEVSAR